uniref:Uncharacterized protein n=1 Tax=Ipomoea trifida TaxID=35884 RepID=A0PAC0_IPOTF|nr:hypothetical protein [Ipomoea trifida]
MTISNKLRGNHAYWPLKTEPKEELELTRQNGVSKWDGRSVGKLCYGPTCTLRGGPGLYS